jgi:uncharacterized membrane protein YjjP (DUF1212 family)
MLHSVFRRLKHGLQYSGWLQYILSAVLALVFLAVAVVQWLGVVDACVTTCES